MDLSRPYSVLSPTLDGTVLGVLAGTTRPLTGREVARLAGRRNHSGVLQALNRLAEQGIADRQEAGRALLYTLNREHLATPAVESLANLRLEFLRRLTDAIRSWRLAPVHASLFGSAARGDGDSASDIDLFIVRQDTVSPEDGRWRQQIDGLASQVNRWTGNRANVAEVANDELGRLRRERPPILAQLQADAITLAGPEPSALLEDAR